MITFEEVRESFSSHPVPGKILRHLEPFFLMIFSQKIDRNRPNQITQSRSKIQSVLCFGKITFIFVLGQPVVIRINTFYSLLMPPINKLERFALASLVTSNAYQTPNTLAYFVVEYVTK
jgi:hypothetical protein